MKKDTFLDNIWNERAEAIKRSDEKHLDEIKKSISKKRKTPFFVIFLIGFLLITFIILNFLLFTALRPNHTIEYRTTERVVERQPIIQEKTYNNTVNNMIVPENSANCIKITIPGEDKFTLNCEKVK